MSTFFNKTVNACLTALENYKPPEIDESLLAVRIIGEFSSGKTRFLNELFGSLIPEKLQPVSGLSKETAIPLEITYGDKVELNLVKRGEESDQAKPVMALDHFPRRNEAEKLYQPGYSLRMTLPHEHLILGQGDTYSGDEAPKKLRIIDYPGWNTEDELRGWEELGLTNDMLNLALVMVIRPNRVDGKENRKNIKMFLDAVLDGDIEYKTERMPLFFIIPACAKEDRKPMQERVEAMVREILGDSVDDHPLFIRALDFADMSEEEKTEFRADFWRHCDTAGPKTGYGHKKPAAPVADVRQYLADSAEYLAKLTEVVQALRVNGKYLGGRDMNFFKGIAAADLPGRVIRDWKTRLPTYCRPEQISRLQPPDLAKDHPLRTWLDVYWLPRLHFQYSSVMGFLQKMESVLQNLTPDISDLEQWLKSQIDDKYETLTITSTFAYIFQTLSQKANDENFLQTLMALSMLEARFPDTYEQRI